MSMRSCATTWALSTPARSRSCRWKPRAAADTSPPLQASRVPQDRGRRPVQRDRRALLLPALRALCSLLQDRDRMPTPRAPCCLPRGRNRMPAPRALYRPPRDRDGMPTLRAPWHRIPHNPALTARPCGTVPENHPACSLRPRIFSSAISAAVKLRNLSTA